jgi:acetolactate synthase I/II/III large subunit
MDHPTTVADAVGRTLAGLGVDLVFGVVGSGNFHVTNGLVAGGARYVATRHEGGAATMADGYARVSGRVGALSVHQGCGLSNAVTGIAEAAKSRTPLLVVAAETATTDLRSNFRIDQSALVTAVGAVSERVHSPRTALIDAARALRRAAGERRTVVLNLPLDVQAAPLPSDALPVPPAATVPYPPGPAADAVRALAAALTVARRPVFLAGRGARGARQALETLADRVGALLATSAVAKGLFTGSPWSLDVSGGFSSPLAASLIAEADLVVAWGCGLSRWTTRNGSLIGAGTTVVQVDLEPDAIGATVPVHLGVVGEVGRTATAVADELGAGSAPGYRSDDLRERIAAQVRWRDVPHTDGGEGTRIDPRTLSIALDDLLPRERVVAVDSGNFMGYPSMYLSVPDEHGFCFTQAFQSIGLGLATAVGAALARPDRLPVAALGDGGALMGISELDTVVRLGLPMVVVVYDDEAYGAEVHHFGPLGHDLETVVFPPTDIASIGRGFGCEAVTVRDLADLAAVSDWLAGPMDRPIVIDAKVTADRGSWWLEEAFQTH